IDVLGYEEDQKQLYLDALEQPQGMILVTGFSTLISFRKRRTNKDWQLYGRLYQRKSFSYLS
ncbi:MAG TPA: hypothetical protein VK982_12005, partial [Bacteroidales bacterium]|nr:hypothetical protein [Bacteroidales bacterium]